MGKGYIDLTPEQRAAAAERARLLRLIGERSGITRFANDLKKLREAKTATPQEPTPPRRQRGRGGGRKRSLTPDQIERGIRILQSQSRMTIEAARAALRAAGIESGNSALYRLVIAPAYGISDVSK